MVQYDIEILNIDTLVEWLKQQPGLLSDPITSVWGSKKIVCEFEHDSKESIEFKKEIANRLLTIDNTSLVDSLMKYIKEIQTDQLFASILRQIPITNIGTSYADVFPAFYNGFPIPIDTTGYTKLGVVLLWNKNGGTGRHDARLIDHNGNNDVLISTELMPSGLPSGTTKNYDIPIPEEFENFRGELRIQAKSSVGTDDPVFDGLLIYLIR